MLSLLVFIIITFIFHARSHYYIFLEFDDIRLMNDMLIY